MSSVSIKFPSASLLFPPFEKGGQGGFAFRARAEQNPEQIPLDPPFSKGESRAADSCAVEHLIAKRRTAKRRVAASPCECSHCERSLFPPLKKGGRGDLLFVSEQSKTKSKSPLIPLFQRGRFMLWRDTP